MDKLNEMFLQQKQLQARLGTIKKMQSNPLMRQNFINQMLLAAHEELVEIGRETLLKDKCMPFGWKQCQPNNQKCKEEIIDLWHFLMNLWIAVDGTPEEFYTLYMVKNNTNHMRHKNNGKY